MTLNIFDVLINHFKELNKNLDFETFRNYLISNYPFLLKDVFDVLDVKKARKLR